jgi:hypothetical protein
MGSSYVSRFAIAREATPGGVLTIFGVTIQRLDATCGNKRLEITWSHNASFNGRARQPADLLPIAEQTSPFVGGDTLETPQPTGQGGKAVQITKDEFEICPM